jgi:3-hydroxyisobutyrate dehydrogenase
MKITFLGQGAMGQRMANRLEEAGHAVTRWNRSGGTQTPRQAVTGAEIVIAMLRDDEASKSVWLNPETGALLGMDPNAIAIESSTLTVNWVKELAAAVYASGRSFVDAPVLGSRPQAEAGQLTYLIGGDPSLVGKVEPLLAVMSSKQLHVGPVSAGAAMKLIANTLFGIQVTAMAELIGRMPDLGLDPANTIEMLSETPLLSISAKGAAGLMLSSNHDPMFPVELVAKDFGYAVGDNAKKMPIANAAKHVFDQATEAGFADANLTAVAMLYGKAG